MDTSKTVHEGAFTAADLTSTSSSSSSEFLLTDEVLAVLQNDDATVDDVWNGVMPASRQATLATCKLLRRSTYTTRIFTD